MFALDCPGGAGEACGGGNGGGLAAGSGCVPDSPEAVIATTQFEPDDAERLGRRLRAFQSQLPESERALLSAVIAAAAVSGIALGAAEVVVEQPTAAATVAEAAGSAAAPVTDAAAAIREQFRTAFTPGAAWDIPTATDIRLEPKSTR